MKVLFAIVDGGGNVPPQLAVARMLHSRGVEVHAVGHAGVRDRVEAAGLPFETFSAGRPFDPTRPRPLAKLMADFARIASDRSIGRGILDAATRHGVDAIVVDMMLVGAIDEIARSEFPAVIFTHCFYRAVQDLAAGPVGWLLRLRGIDPLRAEHSGLVQVVAARADLDPIRGSPPVSHTGVVWQGTPTPMTPASTPRILVSLSTNAFAGQRRMLQNILTALDGLPVETIVTVGPSIDARGLEVPSNTTVHTWLDHDTVLGTASLVIGHGGHSTAMRALSFGVPQIVMPANPMIDQKRVGAALQKAGAGLLLPKHARPQRIRSAVQKVLDDDSYRRAADELGASIREQDGAAIAADMICEFLETRTPRVTT
ncbi:glycosyltransferase [Mycolicibacterium sp. BiH015]|uniref:glycosyltransferase n=1 Tax=Mycolicibacterium sp. BiH015 TaxID=3018808 RepID=UPI0022E0DB3D|nr:nucleotide disphospho-sugar-binding domain-containing protein [Mycolicibacterium sp. BiH015]MDA2895128.1 glycosyltransferase [Mycolicibacterium sp. BiH015]